MEVAQANYHLLFVDDDIMLNEFLKHYLSQQTSYQITLIDTEDDIVNVLKKHNIDLIVLDIIMAGHDGMYWLKWLKTYHPHIPVIMMSSKQQADTRIQGFELGAEDYIIKPIAPREVLLRIQRTLKQHKKQPEQIHMGQRTFDLSTKRLSCEGLTIHLTDREERLLALFCSQPNQTFTRDDISISLTGSPHNPMDRSIDIYINRLRNKIEDNPRKPKYLKTVRGQGYCLYLLDK